MTQPMRDITPRQIQQEQTDAWRVRHDIRSDKPTPFGVQQILAVNADHTEAHEMDADTPAVLRARRIAATHAQALEMDAAPGETAASPGRRARQIAAIYALADFYVTHPEEPMPQSIVAVTHLFSGDGLDEADRVIQVMEFAARHHLKPTESWNDVKARLELLDIEGMGVAVSQIAYITPANPARYVR